MRPIGEVTERLNVPVSKTGIRASVSWVRIPPSPPNNSDFIEIFDGFRLLPINLPIGARPPKTTQIALRAPERAISLSESKR